MAEKNGKNREPKECRKIVMGGFSREELKRLVAQADSDDFDPGRSITVSSKKTGPEGEKIHQHTIVRGSDLETLEAAVAEIIPALAGSLGLAPEEVLEAIGEAALSPDSRKEILKKAGA